MYKFVKVLFHCDPRMSHVAYLYQDMTTDKYYLSYTSPNSEDRIDYSNQYFLINNEPKITKQSFLKHINIEAEVTLSNFLLHKINNYIL
jgi:hypothetical protein